MARNKGVTAFAVNFEPGSQAPFDARLVVPATSDLMNAYNDGRNVYDGMPVLVLTGASGKAELWVLTHKDQYLAVIGTDAASATDAHKSYWQRIDADQTAIDGAVAAAQSTLQGSLDALTARVAAAETSITSQETGRINGDLELGGRIDTLEATVAAKLDAADLVPITEAEITALFA